MQKIGRFITPMEHICSPVVRKKQHGILIEKSIRKAICVVTGTEEGLQRHHIVPYCYRTYFPEKYKSKNHHDVVLINHEIHSEYERLATLYKDEIAQMFNIKTITEFNIEYTYKLREIGKENAILLNNIYSLFKTYGKVTENVLLEKLQQISKTTRIPFKTIRNYNYIQLYKMYLLLKEQQIKEQYKFKQNHRKEYDHGYHVVQQLNNEDKFEDFVKLWRKHFIDTMNPQFMPNGWSIDFRIKTNI